MRASKANLSAHFKTAKAAVAVFISAMLALAPWAGAQNNGVWIGTSRVGSPSIEIAVPEFPVSWDDKEGLGAQAADVINFDLKATGMFKPHENKDFLKQASEKDLKAKGGVDFDEWKTLVSNFVVKGVVGQKPDGKIYLDTRVYDIQQRKLYFSKIYTGPKAIFRQMAHQFSDDLLNRLTGEQGIARTRMAFVSKQMGRKELFIMDYDGYNPIQVTTDKSMVLFPNWHPKKDLILFTTFRYRNPDLYAMDLRNGTRYPVSRKIGSNSTGEWSPDGKRVVFSLTKGGNADIYIANADGGSVVQLTSAPSIETSPAISPDGRYVAFSSDRTGSPQIYIMSLDGKENWRATWTGGYNEGAAWSPKGDYIAYASMNGNNFNISVVNWREPRDVRQLTAGAGSEESPTWAPNGRNIAFAARRNGTKQIFIINSDGTNQTPVTSMPGGGYTPSWGPPLDLLK
ncbi:MAG: Tol-Pal system beta propeller repeat protein TolB [Nitrospinae bacterium]|nr:Tol-Pal system beta propeller repeat protein TolB [Nitrospinota bacterium]